jgi:threonine dehydrogenase-like Zn-dependent dehydrogenase
MPKNDRYIIPHAAMSAIAAASNPSLQGAYSSRRQGIHGYSVDYALDRVKQMGAVVNKALTIRSSQVFAPKYIPRLLDHATRGEVAPSFMLTHKSCLRML